jgi:hypothetical protein
VHRWLVEKQVGDRQDKRRPTSLTRCAASIDPSNNRSLGGTPKTEKQPTRGATKATVSSCHWCCSLYEGARRGMTARTQVPAASVGARAAPGVAPMLARGANRVGVPVPACDLCDIGAVAMTMLPVGLVSCWREGGAASRPAPVVRPIGASVRAKGRQSPGGPFLSLTSAILCPSACASGHP